MGAEQLMVGGLQRDVKMNRRMDIAGQSFIVTGAKGIGLAISSLFHSLGAGVWLDLDDSGMKDNLSSRQWGVDVTDRRRQAGCRRLAVLGDIDGIVANAGVNGPQAIVGLFAGRMANGDVGRSDWCSDRLDRRLTI